MRSAATAVAFVVLASSVALAQPAQLWNTGVASTSLNSDGGRFYALESEGSIHADVNGDGDTADTIVRVQDPVTKAVTNLPFAVVIFSSFPRVATGGDYEVFALDEDTHFGTSWNGDADHDDEVLVIHRISTNTCVVVPLAVDYQYFDMATNGSIATVIVPEFRQQVDLNGDGDLLDRELVAIDPATGVWQVVALVSPSFDAATRIFTNGDVLFLANEGVDLVDRNGDGDLDDDVPRLWTRASGTLATIPFAIDYTSHMTVTPDEQRIVLSVTESSQGSDLSGDGDLGDWVPRIVDRATLVVTAVNVTGLVSTGRRVDDSHLVVIVEEISMGQDRNGDGDLLDSVPAILDVTNGQVTNVGIALVPGGGVFEGDGFFAFARLETIQNPPTDFDDDGDTWDNVPFVYVVATGELLRVPIPLPLHGQNMMVATKTGFLFMGDESQHDFTNYTFDDNATDRAAFYFDVPSRRLMNLARSMSTLGETARAPDQIAFEISEAEEGAGSLNGDGDTTDVVFSILDAGDFSLFDPGFASSKMTINANPWTTDGSTRMNGVEAWQGADLNGDGDLNDPANLIYTPLAHGCGRFVMYGQGCATSAGSIPELEAHGCAIPGGPVRLQVRRGIPGQNAFLVLGTQAASIPLGGGCNLLTSPLLPFVFGPIFLPSNGRMLGATLLATNLPAGAIPGTIRVQAFVTDPGWPKGYAVSNGLELEISP